MDESHIPFIFVLKNRFQYTNHWCKTNTTTNEYDRILFGLIKNEFTSRSTDFQYVAFINFLVKVIGYYTCRLIVYHIFAFHSDTIVGVAWRCRQAIVPEMSKFLIVRLHSNCNILTRQIGRDFTTVFRY
ncbi:hypothetical protein D3C81_1477580 [compost metagenome]